MSTPALFKWRHFLPEIILLNVRWYCRYSLSYRDLEEMMQERVAEVFLGNQSVGLRMVREGMSVVYPQYLNGCAANKAQYLQAEAEAKRQGFGVWNRSNPLKVMPWDFRRQRG